MRTLGLVLLVVCSCANRKETPDPYAKLALPDVAVQVEPAPTTGALVTFEMATPPDTMSKGMNMQEIGDPGGPTRLAIDPKAPYRELLATMDRVITDSYMLLVRTPRGVGALRLYRPRAQTGDIVEAKLVLSIARTANGEPQLFLGSKSVTLDELPAALRDSKRDQVFIDVDHQTTVGTFAKVLAAAHGIVEVELLVRAKPPKPMPAPR